MDILSPYNLLIEASIILIISFFFGELSKRTSVPAVLMLIVLGVIAKLALSLTGTKTVDFFPVLNVLGIVGLIMIVLEAALELKLEKGKFIPIAKAFGIAVVGLLLSTWITAEVLHYFIPEMSKMIAWIHATPLSILSSAIVIPSVVDLTTSKKEFHIYESTFSDIMGIILFYFLLSQAGSGEHAPVEDGHGGGGWFVYVLTILLTIVLSIIFSYLIIIIFQHIRSSAKLFLLISVLLLLYAVGKLFHLSSLIIILIFGLTIANMKLFFSGPMKKFLHYEKAHDIFHGLHIITLETAFVVRTFFFVIFGFTIVFSSLASWKVAGVSALMLLVIYVVRYVTLRVSIRKDILPQLFIAPRGLITILLFYAIPKNLQSSAFSEGYLLFLIIGTGVIMTIAMIYDKNRRSTSVKKANNIPINEVKWRLPGQ